MAREHKVLAGLVAAGTTLGLAKWQLSRLFTEQPDYAVESKHDGLELRTYRPRVVAETTVESGDWEAALQEGFRRLARYIFGGNTGRQKIAMTAPVSASTARPEKIAMTSPVTARSGDQGVTVTFTMPRARDLASLPAPIDERVRLRRQAGERVAALKFRGTYRAPRIREMEAELLRRVEEMGLVTTGTSVFAGYDAPSTLPFLRRVEVWVPIAEPDVDPGG